MQFSSIELERRFKNLDTEGVTPFVSALVFEIIDKNYGGVIENLNITHIKLPNISGYFHSPRPGNRRLKVEFLIDCNSIVLTPQNLEIIDDEIEKRYKIASSLALSNTNRTNYFPIEYFNFAQKQMNCTIGWSCKGENGYACLSKSKKNCNIELDSNHKAYIDWLDKNKSAEADLFTDLENSVNKTPSNSKVIATPQEKTLLNKPKAFSESDSAEDVISTKDEWSKLYKKGSEEAGDDSATKLRIDTADDLHDSIVRRAKKTHIKNNFKVIKDENGVIQSLANWHTKFDSYSVFVDHLVSAPWNILQNDKRSTKGSGTELMLSLVRESIKLGHGGRITLEPVDDAKFFMQSWDSQK
jgi:hypothetical protein